MRNLGALSLFLDCAIFRDLPWAPVGPGVSVLAWASGTDARSSEAVFLGNIRTVVALTLFLDPRQLPRASVLALFDSAAGTPP